VARVDALLEQAEVFEHLWAEKVLSFRAAFLCSRLGRLIPQIAAIYWGGGSHEDEIRELASQFAPADACLLLAAAILSRLFNPEDLVAFQAISFGDLPESDWVEQFNPEVDKTDVGLDDINLESVNFEGIVRFVIGYANRSAGGSAVMIPLAPRPAAPAVDSSLASMHEFSTLPWERMRDAAGKKKREESERRLRDRMGPRFEELCPTAQASLVGAEFTLLDEHWHPGPSQALVAMSVAFEAELRDAFLPLLADFVMDNGLQPFPKIQVIITTEGEINIKGSLLDSLRRAMNEQEDQWARCCESSGLDFKRVKWAIKQVTGPRNKGAHEGNDSFDYVRACRDRWLDPARGIFAPLCRRGAGQ
jgi:hypothetical protein